MILKSIFQGTLPGLEKVLDLTFKRNEAITSNVANADTPRYRAVDLHFGSELERAFGENSSPLERTHEQHLDVTGQSGSHFIPDLSGVTKPDGNNVDIDLQMGRLAYNFGKYSAAANLVRKKFQLLGTAIRTIA